MASSLSISLDGLPTPSPFPSPSSSFLTPPTPGAHEFAVKPPPRKRNDYSPRSSTSSTNHIPPAPPFSIRTSLELPPSPTPRTNLINRGSRPLSTASTTSTTSHNSVCSSPSAFDPNLFSSRPAPPSPGGGSTPSLSRKPSTRSKPVSRANSLRHHHRASSHASLSSSPVPTLATRGERAATPHSHRVSAGSPIHSRTFSSPSSSSSLASPIFDMGISPSSPTLQGILTATSIATLSSEGSSGSPCTFSTSVSTETTTDTHLEIPSSTQQPTEEHKVFIKIRDFAFQPADERFNGQGPLVPKPNRVGRMNRRLGAKSNSISSSDGDGVDDEEEDDDDDDDGGGESDGWGWNAGGYGTRGFGYGGGWIGGRFSWAVSSGTGTGAATAATIFDQEKAYATAAANLSAAAAASKANGNADGYPSRSEMDRNFLDSESEEYYDAEDNQGLYDEEEGDEEEEEKPFEDASSVVGGDDEDDEPLYPGLYRALYAFEPEGTAEMRLVEDQIVRVVGRGGGVGWAVVVAEPREQEEEEEEQGNLSEIVDSIIVDGGNVPKPTMKHALVPESYLEPFRLDWELDVGDAATNNRRTA